MKNPIGINPIGWSNDDFRTLGGDIPLETCLREAREAGYEGIELGHKMERRAEILRPLLERHGLRLVSGWHSSYLLENNLEDEEKSFRQHLRFLKDMGCKVAIVAECTRRNYHHASMHMDYAGGAAVLTAKEWDTLAAGLERLAAIAAAEGLPLAYHHHMGTLVQDGAQLDALMVRTSPAVGLTADAGHMAFAGMNPVDYFRRYKSRIRHAHLKDVRADVVKWARTNRVTFFEAVKNGVYTVPSDGALDFPALLKELQSVNYSGWLVVEAEQDPKVSNPFKMAQKARQFLRAQGY